MKNRHHIKSRVKKHIKRLIKDEFTISDLQKGDLHDALHDSIYKSLCKLEKEGYVKRVKRGVWKRLNKIFENPLTPIKDDRKVLESLKVSHHLLEVDEWNIDYLESRDLELLDAKVTAEGNPSGIQYTRMPIMNIPLKNGKIKIIDNFVFRQVYRQQTLHLKHDDFDDVLEFYRKYLPYLRFTMSELTLRCKSGEVLHFQARSGSDPNEGRALYLINVNGESYDRNEHVHIKIFLDEKGLYVHECDIKFRTVLDGADCPAGEEYDIQMSQ